jgi:hypothetical protein
LITIDIAVWQPTPSRLKPVPQVASQPTPLTARDASRTGFSREEAGLITINIAM